jgi:translation initiation factor IF-3
LFVLLSSFLEDAPIPAPRRSRPEPAPSSNKGPTLLNHRIQATEVRLIYNDEARVVSRQEAEQLAAETGLDLLVVSLESHPPVVKLTDFGKFKYEADKKAKEARKKQHTITVKEVKMGVRIDDNDYRIKRDRATEFLKEGDKVKLTLRLKGREIQHSRLAFDLVSQFVKDLEEVGTLEGTIRQDGRAFVVYLSPKPLAKPTVSSTKSASVASSPAAAPSAKAPSPSGVESSKGSKPPVTASSIASEKDTTDAKNENA